MESHAAASAPRQRSVIRRRQPLRPRLHLDRGQQVPQQHDIAHLPDLLEPHAPVGVPREHTARDEPRRLGLADEEWRDGEVELVYEARGEELGQDPGAAPSDDACLVAPPPTCCYGRWSEGSPEPGPGEPGRP